MQADGNLVLFDGVGGFYWTSNTAGYNGYMTLATDGNLLVKNAAGSTIFWVIYASQPC